MRVCPECGEKGWVTQIRSASQHTSRRVHCRSCGHRWSTIETLVPAAPIPVPRMTRDARKITRRGCVVPAEREEEWRILKKSHLTNKEAAQAMGLDYTPNPPTTSSP